MTFEHFILELAPFVLGALTLTLFFLFLMVRTIFGPKKQRKLTKQEQREVRQMSDAAVKDLLIRCSDLQQRVDNLEEIMRMEKVYQD